jgi:hypothetical protein
MRLTSGGLILLLLACLGCENLQQENARLRADLRQANERIDELTRTVEQQTARLDAQARQIRTLQDLGDKRLEKLFTVESLHIGRHTGGIDTDDKPGHDAIIVYLKPKDAQGATLKAAGSVKIQLFDLAAENGRRDLATWSFDVEEARGHYASGIMTDHYSFELPLEARPAHADLTLRAEFTDYLTGRTFDAQDTFTIKLPPAP